jgi:hypothetical protein
MNTRRVGRRADSPVYSPDLFVGIWWTGVGVGERRLTAWEGNLPMLSTLVRTGKTGWDTPRDTFRTVRKVMLEGMARGGDPSDPGCNYTPSVPGSCTSWRADSPAAARTGSISGVPQPAAAA